MRGLTPRELRILDDLVIGLVRDVDDGEDDDLHTRLTERGLLRLYEDFDDDGDLCDFWEITPLGRLVVAMVKRAGVDADPRGSVAT